MGEPKSKRQVAAMQFIKAAAPLGRAVGDIYVEFDHRQTAKGHGRGASIKQTLLALYGRRLIEGDAETLSACNYLFLTPLGEAALDAARVAQNFATPAHKKSP